MARSSGVRIGCLGGSATAPDPGQPAVPRLLGGTEGSLTARFDPIHAQRIPCKPFESVGSNEPLAQQPPCGYLARIRAADDTI